MMVSADAAPEGPEQDQALELVRITDELTRKHPEVSADRVQALVQTSADSLRRHARVTDFIPVLVVNEVTAVLRRSAA